MLDLSYRGRELPLSSLLDEIRLHAIVGRPTLVGVDGRAGAGKSTLCDALAALDSSIATVHTDDFYVPAAERIAPETEIGRQIDWRRVLEEVVMPLIDGRPGGYRRFDWGTQSLAEWRRIPPTSMVLLDGVYSTREEIAPYLAYRIWVDVPRGSGLDRAIMRDGEDSEDWWMDDWVEDEDRYVVLERPESQADTVIDGTASPALYGSGAYRRVR